MTDHDPHRATPAGKPRARALGIPFAGRPGRWNAITDVPGVEVGYVTLIEGTGVRTGVTAIHPRGRAGAGDPVAAGFHSQNGNGEMTGVSWIAESGTFTGPVAITNTHAVGIAHAGIVAWAIEHHPAVTEAWLLPVAAETWDGYLNDINGHHVTEESVVAALEAAGPGPVEEGSVGGGTGMNCYEFKGGSGTASRLVPYNGTEYAVGVFLQANFGGREELVLAGPPRHPGPGPHRHQRLALLRRPVPGLLHREPRRLPPGRHGAGSSGPAAPRLHPVGAPGPVLRGRRAGHRGGRGQRPGGERGHDRPGRPSHPRPAPRAGRRTPSPSRSPVPVTVRRTTPPDSPSTPPAATPGRAPARPAPRSAARTDRECSGSRCRAAPCPPSRVRAPAAAPRRGTAPARRRTR